MTAFSDDELRAMAAEVSFHDRTVRKLARELLEARQDARRYQWLRDIQCNHFSLSLNEDPAINYVTVKKFIEEFDPEWLHDIEPDELQKMKDTNTLWHLQIYPNTPIGFNVYFGATLDEAIDAALAEGK